MIRVLRYALTVVFFIGLACAFAIFVLDIPMPWKAVANDEPAHPINTEPEVENVQLVQDIPHTVAVPESVRLALGARHGNKDNLATAMIPTKFRNLVLPGSTALDPGRIVRARIRFAPAETVKIFEYERHDPPSPGSVASQFHELRPGDRVHKGDPLATLYSADVGNKKNDLFEAVIQYRLDKIILERAEKNASALPDVFLWNARRNVQTDRSGIIRAENTLKIWNIEDKDIEDVVKEANQYDLNAIMSDKDPKLGGGAEWGRNKAKWAEVILKAPSDGVIIERNISRGEVVIDNTLNLFTIARVDRLAVLSNLPEDDLPTLREGMRWEVKTVGANADREKGLPGFIEEIGYLIDPNQHTAMVKGYIDNPGERIRAGQFVTTTVKLPAPEDVVEIPANAIVEDGRQSVVFVQTNAEKGYYTMRRVLVTHRLENKVLVRSKIPDVEQLTPEEKREGLLPRQALQPNEKVLVSGVLELKASLLDLEDKLGQR
jgi:membrane fusion protein, heavy metal efflux system